jgi:N-formylglutamate amidohydrolase
VTDVNHAVPLDSSKAPFFEQDNSDSSPVLIHVPHSSIAIHANFRSDFLLNDLALDNEATTMADIATDQLAIATCDASSNKPSLFINKLSRLVFDPERFNDDSEEMNAVGMGVLYSKTSSGLPLRNLTPERSKELIDLLYNPYSEALQALVERILNRHGKVIIIDLHSYSKEALEYELHKDLPRPEVCLGVDSLHTSPGLLSLAKTTFGEQYEVSINAPFIGTYVPLKFYSKDQSIQSIMLELRKDVYSYADTDAPKFNRVVNLLARLVDEIHKGKLLRCS